jgi:hypothetical protein
MVLRPAHPSEHPVRGARRENDDGDMAALQLYHTHTAAQADVLILFTSTGYMLLGLISSLVFRAIRDTLPNNPETQKRILGASMTALSLADVSTTYSFFFRLTTMLLGYVVSWLCMLRVHKYVDKDTVS